MDTANYKVIEVKSPHGTTYVEEFEENMFEFYGSVNNAVKFFEEDAEYDVNDWKSYITKDDCETTYYRMVALEQSDDYSFTVKDLTVTYEVK